MGRSSHPSSVAPAALAVLVAGGLACSSSSAPDMPAANCSYFQTTLSLPGASVSDAGDAGNAGDAGDAGAPPAWCLPSDIATADASTGLACTVLVALPGKGSESACTGAGLTPPDATTLMQAQSNFPQLASQPLCLVPACSGAACATECVDGSAAAWCAVTSASSCEKSLAVSPAARVTGATYVVACLAGC